MLPVEWQHKLPVLTQYVLILKLTSYLNQTIDSIQIINIFSHNSNKSRSSLLLSIDTVFVSYTEADIEDGDVNVDAVILDSGPDGL